MFRILFFSFFLIITTKLWAKDSAPTQSETNPSTQEVNPDAETLADTVRLIRKMKDTEVFFKNQKDQYILPNSKSHNKILEELVFSQKSGTSVSLSVNKKTRQILGISGSSGKNAPTKSEQKN